MALARRLGWNALGLANWGLRGLSQSVLIAFGITAVVCVGITLFAFQTRFDFSGWGLYLFVAFIVLFVASIIAAIVRDRVADIVMSALFVLLFCFYLVYDTQMIVGMRLPVRACGIACGASR